MVITTQICPMSQKKTCKVSANKNAIGVFAFVTPQHFMSYVMFMFMFYVPRMNFSRQFFFLGSITPKTAKMEKLVWLFFFLGVLGVIEPEKIFDRKSSS